jgi:single-strand DNA-binding protein
MKNAVSLIGNVGSDPEVKETEKGKLVKFTLATSFGEKTTWHNILAWNKTAELIEKYVNKGDKVDVEGRIDNRSYDDKDGNKRYVSDIVCHQIIFLGSKAAPKENHTESTKDDLPF